MLSLLLWCTWIVVQLWIGRNIMTRWITYKRKKAVEGNVDDSSPEFKTLLAVLLSVLGNAFMRVFVDLKNFYPRTPEGFYGTGYTEAQWLCGFAWLIVTIYAARLLWYALHATDSDSRWTLSCTCAILFLLGTSVVLHFVFQMPLGSS